jgi:peptide chain release factor subunit 1
MSKNVSPENQWDSIRRYKLRRMINKLSGISGHGTELVTVYIPPRRPIYDVIAQLRNEAGTASNIKSDLTRTHVQDALSRTMEYLKLYKETPESGLIIFCGALPTGKGSGTEKIEIFPVIPPKPVQIQLYRCDDHFWTDHLNDMMKEDKTMGLLTIDTQEAGVGVLSGDRWQVEDTLTSGVSGKHRQGGQSARRFERLRDNELNEYYKRIAERANRILIDQHKVRGLVVGGPGPTKDTFLKEEYLDYRLQGNVIAVLDTSYSGEEGVRELIDKVNEEGVMDGYRLMEEKKLVKRFMKEVYSDKGLGIYGIKDVVRALQNGIVDLVLVTDDISAAAVEVKCKKCGDTTVEIMQRSELLSKKQELLGSSCSKCGVSDRELSDRDIVEYLEDLASSTGTGLEVISGKSEEGAQVSSLGKVGAILRFRPVNN